MLSPYLRLCTLPGDTSLPSISGSEATLRVGSLIRNDAPFRMTGRESIFNVRVRIGTCSCRRRGPTEEFSEPPLKSMIDLSTFSAHNRMLSLEIGFLPRAVVNGLFQRPRVMDDVWGLRSFLKLRLAVHPVHTTRTPAPTLPIEQDGIFCHKRVGQGCTPY